MPPDSSCLQDASCTAGPVSPLALLGHSFPPACLHSPRLLHAAPSVPKLPSAPHAHSQLRDVMPGFQRKAKQPEVNFPSCGPRRVYVCAHVWCVILSKLPAHLPVSSPCPSSPVPTTSFFFQHLWRDSEWFLCDDASSLSR